MKFIDLAAIALAVASSTACNSSLRDGFVSGRVNNPCLQAIPACPGQSAACIMNDRSYTATRFPGQFSFLVNADADDEIEVRIFLDTQEDTGLDTQIFWNEPGCVDLVSLEISGFEIFDEAEDLGYVAYSEEVDSDGDHLIEIFSDMRAHVLISASVIVPGQR